MIKFLDSHHQYHKMLFYYILYLPSYFFCDVICESIFFCLNFLVCLLKNLNIISELIKNKLYTHTRIGLALSLKDNYSFHILYTYKKRLNVPGTKFNP